MEHPRQTVETAVHTMLGSLGLGTEGVVVEYVADAAHGDFATNAAMVHAKAAGKNPRALAEEMVSALGTITGVEKIEIAGPGFVNFTLAQDALGAAVEQIVTSPETWGRSDALAGEFVMLEYTSPNLFKPLHVGNLVGNIVGESLGRLFTAAGATVKRINYPSDIGLTVAKGVWGIKTTGGNPDDIAALGEAYRVGNEAYETDPAAKAEIEAVNRDLYAGTNEELNDVRRRGIATSRARIAELCRMLGTEFDTEIFESDASPVGQQLVAEHVADGVFVKSDGATVFPGELYGLHTRVFLNSQGLPTYEAKDVGNFQIKQERYPDWTESIVVTGSEQREYFQVVYAAIRKLFPDAQDKKLLHVPTGFLTLTTGKMSSRKGNVLTGESLLADMQESAHARAEESRADDIGELAEQIAVAGLKYEILRRGTGSDIIFDKAKALSLEGDSGPYIQYAYARAQSVLAAGTEAGVEPQVAAPTAEGERGIARLLMQFPDVVARAQRELEPHYVANYAGELAAAYNSWYAAERVLGTDAAPRRLALTQAVAVTLKQSLWLLGIQSPERM